MTNSTHLAIEQLVQQLNLNSHEHFTGELRIQSKLPGTSAADPEDWSLYFLLGRLVWANSNGHRFRRWRRAFFAQCPQLYSPALLPANSGVNPFWEYRVIAALLKSGKVQREKAIALVEHLIGEVLFDILQGGEFYQQTRKVMDPTKQLGEPITILNVKQVLNQSQQRLDAWYEAGFVNDSPHLAPYICHHDELRQRISERSYEKLVTLIDGQSTLADLAIYIKQNPLNFMKFLKPLFQRKLMELQQVPDLVPTISIPQPIERPKAQKVPKVLCIDDNPTICWTLDKILTDSGYACINTQDPLQAIPTLLQEKPDLVFLDLVMPIASGYEICAQIRRISAFKDIPVIILTGNDGIVDRVRAKVVGASDFLAKPINPQKVVEVVRRYCPSQSYEPSLVDG